MCLFDLNLYVLCKVLGSLSCLVMMVMLLGVMLYKGLFLLL